MIVSFLIQKRVPRLKRAHTFKKKKYIDIDYDKASGGGGVDKGREECNYLRAL